MRDLDMGQKRAVAAKKIQTLRHEARNEAQSLLGEQDLWLRVITCSPLLIS